MVPGQDTYSMREQSAVQLPVRQDDGEQVPANVKVQEIDAELLIAQTQRRQAAQSGRDRAAGLR